MVRKTLLYAFQTTEGWWIGRLHEEPLGPHKSPEQALSYYCKGRDIAKFQLIMEGDEHGELVSQRTYVP